MERSRSGKKNTEITFYPPVVIQKRFGKLFHWARRRIAKIWLKINSPKIIIGITGSYGKTNSVRAVSQVLSEKYPTLQTDINLDTLYNLPITLLKLRPKHKFAVLEYGIDKINEMDLHLSLVRPEIGVLTGITPVHADRKHFGSLRKIMEEKGKLLSCLPKDGYALLNYDDPNVRKMANRTKARVIWYGTTKNCQIWADKIQFDSSGTTFTVHFNYLNWPKKQTFKTGLIGEHFVQACMAAIFIGKIYGIENYRIKKALRLLKPLPGRLDFKRGPRETILLDDHLRANLASTCAGLKVFSQLPGKRKIAILGEMGEMGKYAKAGHRQIGQMAASLEIDYLFCIGPLGKEMAKAAIKNGMDKEKVFWRKDVLAAGGTLAGLIKEGDFLYLKGSLLRHMERIILFLEGKRVFCKKLSCHHYSQCDTCSCLPLAN